MRQSSESLRKKALTDAARRRSALRWRLLLMAALLAALWWVQPRIGPVLTTTLQTVGDAGR
jgi:hypothetical protein